MDEKPKLSPQQELKDRLRETRANYNSAKKLVGEIERGHAAFVRIRDTLTDPNNGVVANTEWLRAKRAEIETILANANTDLGKLQTAAGSVTAAVTDINEKYSTFNGLSSQIFDEKDGLAAVLKATRRLKNATERLAEQITKDSTDATKSLAIITERTKQVIAAYDNFFEKKALIDNEESGFEAQLKRATSFADDTKKAKGEAETALVSVKTYRDEGEALLVKIKESKGVVEEQEKRSKELTDGIRDTLNKTSAFTLSDALRDRTKQLNVQLIIWGLLVFVSIAALIVAVILIFWGLFVHGTANTEEIAARLQDGPDLVAVFTKILFTTPLVFAVFFTTINFNHVRDLRDKYAWKETVSKNFQNYIKLMNDEFDSNVYEKDRFAFSMETVRAIYTEPNPGPKKRKYNFGLYNKTVQVDIEEEDLQELKQAVTASLSKTVSEQGAALAEIVESAIDEEVTDAVISLKEDNASTKNTQPSKVSIKKPLEPPVLPE